MPTPRKIAVVSGTRADYGLLHGAMKELMRHGADLQWIVTGGHLAASQGYTIRQIEADGFPIAARVDLQLSEDDSPSALAHAMALGLSGIADALVALRPDIVVILGDRYEMLSAASAASILQLPIAHIHGGEVTEGAMDDALRHAITKLSYWHFPAANVYRDRIIQMGEDPARVFHTGAPGLDHLVRDDLFAPQDLARELGYPAEMPLLVVTFHPETLSTQLPSEQVMPLLAALEHETEAFILLTGANADSGGVAINQALQTWVASRSHAAFRQSLGSQLYVSAMRAAQVVVGNSSSGVIEAPALGVATVNIGDRQKGRLKPPSVIDCANETAAIRAALRQAKSSAFRSNLTPCTWFGVPGQVGRSIAALLLELTLPETVRKPFHDRAIHG